MTPAQSTPPAVSPPPPSSSAPTPSASTPAQTTPSSGPTATPTATAASEPSPAPTPSPLPAYRDTSLTLAARVRDLLGRMSLAEKVGQMTLIERSDLRNPMDVATYNLGGVLSGGGSAPVDNTPDGWANMVDTFQAAATSTRLGIPILYGTDAVHGHGNLLDSTIFPHNIGIGATRDAQLAQLIGRATAEETAATGANWTFSPCLCVARDIRWGRTYESFSEDPQVVADLASVIGGYQGAILGAGPASILATAKHYLGDGGTRNGVNDGDTKLNEVELRAIHLLPYGVAVEQGVGSVMASFSSVDGIQMHANGHLINDVLKAELGFEGFVVSDWQAIDRIDGARGDASREDVSTAVNAGVDMIMVPFGARAFEATLTEAIVGGDIPQQRVDDAVRRIIAVKIRMGLFEHPLTDRTLSATVGSAEHRALARRAVAASLVVLKNQGDLLPLKKGGRILVAGKNADDIGSQSGGWTVTWQGAAGATRQGTSILAGIREVAGSAGTIDYNEAGLGAEGHDLAIAVLGEEPYAESEGDRHDGLELDAADRSVLDNLVAAAIPIVVVLVSGRPLIVTEQLPDVTALVAAWLPGTEGAGVVDVLYGDAPAVGKLSFSWPRSAEQLPLNVGQADYDPLFPFGAGLELRSIR
jgi:beta-glucosidase